MTLKVKTDKEKIEKITKEETNQNKLKHPNKSTELRDSSALIQKVNSTVRSALVIL
jgi:hypothetical protein